MSICVFGWVFQCIHRAETHLLPFQLVGVGFGRGCSTHRHTLSLTLALSHTTQVRANRPLGEKHVCTLHTGRQTPTHLDDIMGHLSTHAIDNFGSNRPLRQKWGSSKPSIIPYIYSHTHTQTHTHTHTYIHTYIHTHT